MTFWNKSFSVFAVASLAHWGCGAGDGTNQSSSSEEASSSGSYSGATGGTATERGRESGSNARVIEDDAIEAFPDSESCDLQGVSAPLLRRLSHVEYNNTLRDLLGQAAPAHVDLSPDAAIYGFENNVRALGASAVLVEQYAAQAQAAAAAIATAEVGACEEQGDSAEERCGDDFVEQFGYRAFRRPLSSEEGARFSDFLIEQRQTLGARAAIALTAEALLQSPGFLYRVEVSSDTGAIVSSIAEPYAMASRISYLLWQTMPDQELLDAADAGELSSPEQLAEQARRMLDDPRAATTLKDFHRQWLGLGRVLGEAKDRERYPLWQESSSEDALEESMRFVEHIYSQREGSVEGLLTSRVAYVNASLADLYGVDYDSESSEVWQQVELPPERAGILTRAAFLAGFSHPATTSPPLRGVAVLDKLLCARPPPAPAGADTSTPVAEDGLVSTTRQLFTERTAPAQCQGCHVSINGIGMAFEQFDTIGRFRTEENGLPVDATGQLFIANNDGEFDGVSEMSEMLSQSEQVQACAVKNLYRSAFGQTESADDRCRLQSLEQAMIEHRGDLREVLVALVSGAQFAGRAKPLSFNQADEEEL